MNWKIIFGGLLIFAGTAQSIKFLTEYLHNKTLPQLIGLGILSVGLLILGVYLLRQGRKESKTIL